MVDVLATMDISNMLGLIVAGGIIVAIVSLAIYVYTSLALMTIAKKTKTKNGWLAWIPIANFYLLTQIARVNPWWTLILLAFFIPMIGSLVVMVAGIWMFWRIAELRKFPGWVSLLLILPLVNLVVLGILAWGK